MPITRPTSLVICGGGVNGLAIFGALIELTKKKHLCDLQRVAGTSSGALSALCVALNLSADDLQEHIAQFDTKKLLSRASWWKTPGAFFKKFGVFDHDYIQRLVAQIIQEKTGLTDNVTFADLQRCKAQYDLRDLYITATNVSRRIAVVFSHELTPNVRVTDAIRASMALPYVFEGLFFVEDHGGELMRAKKGDLLADGSILNNFALHIFDRYRYLKKPSDEAKHDDDYAYNPDTLGLCLVDSKAKIRWLLYGEKPKANALPTIIHHSTAVSEMMIMDQRLEMLRNCPADLIRTLLISAEGNHPLNFLQGQQTTQVLVGSGKTTAREYLPIRSRL